jgi:hypothetical protein
VFIRPPNGSAFSRKRREIDFSASQTAARPLGGWSGVFDGRC